ncbi:hypothetical protein B484DRAFT_179, partial [Ochromonadaceae sp. CCMP2298]
MLVRIVALFAVLLAVGRVWGGDTEGVGAEGAGGAGHAAEWVESIVMWGSSEEKLAVYHKLGFLQPTQEVVDRLHRDERVDLLFRVPYLPYLQTGPGSEHSSPSSEHDLHSYYPLTELLAAMRVEGMEGLDGRAFWALSDAGMGRQQLLGVVYSAANELRALEMALRQVELVAARTDLQVPEGGSEGGDEGGDRGGGGSEGGDSEEGGREEG